ncbi:hypothetical protein SJI00_02105 [Pseudomonas sp. RP23018S]|uniref:hypothetical protein n=1 Tax=Pseudomonas sp. RP23018S TaxID=3096037 RepID=UPI002ACAFFF3|nr:hypothetical protein [Pseudomonas sp. RP23018S]MDZ5601573.1 hypothetical protein [Pseudomonas sp. RP23018S]
MRREPRHVTRHVGGFVDVLQVTPPCACVAPTSIPQVHKRVDRSLFGQPLRGHAEALPLPASSYRPLTHAGTSDAH